MQAAERVIDSLRTAAREDETDSTANAARTPRLDLGGSYALLYLERARLGLGSPFRLAQSAQQDPRIPASLRRPVAWALVGRALRGETYAVDPSGLSDAPDPWRPGALVDGASHQALIDSAIAAAPTARTGEAAVRLAFALARAERLVPPRIASAAGLAAALTRDRRLAREDARRLLAAADRPSAIADSDALALLATWRSTRRFMVERPLLADDLRADEAAAARSAEGLLAVLRTRAAADSSLARPVVAVPADTATADANIAASLPMAPPPIARGPCLASDLLPCRVAARLTADPGLRTGRPDPFVTITLGGFRSTVTSGDDAQVDDSSLVDETRLMRRLASRARTADALAVEWVRLRASMPLESTGRRHLTTQLMDVAVAARPFGQEPVWPADDATRDVQQVADELRLRSGIDRILFDRGTPAGWRVPALRELGEALADMRSTFPNVRFDGLAVRIGGSPKGDLALALHDPASRTIYLPPTSGAGTIAHELAHDLDWQAARTQLGLRGTYATDRAARLGREPLAAAVRGLSDTRARGATRQPLPDARPAELFARGADWFVASMLARDGRMNGALSAVQDLNQPGFAGATAPVPGTGSAEAVLVALQRVTLIAPSSAAWFRGRFGPLAPRPALEVARLALESAPNWSAERRLMNAGVPVGLAPSAPTSAAAVSPAGICPLEPWQRRLLWISADARARGMLHAQSARAVVGGWGPWQSRATLGAPWQRSSLDVPRSRLRDGLLRAAMAELRVRTPFGDVAACH